MQCSRSVSQSGNHAIPISSFCIVRPLHHVYILLMQYGTPSGKVQHGALHLHIDITDNRGAPECLHCPIPSSVVRANFEKEAFSSFLSRARAFFSQIAVNSSGPLGSWTRGIGPSGGCKIVRTCSRKNAAQWIS